MDGVKKTDVIIITESHSNESVKHIKKVGKEHTKERELNDGWRKYNKIKNPANSN